VIGLFPPCLGAQRSPYGPIDTTAAWVRVNLAWKSGTPERPSDNSLRFRLLDMSERDQAMRGEFGTRVADSRDAAFATVVRVPQERANHRGHHGPGTMALRLSDGDSIDAEPL